MSWGYLSGLLRAEKVNMLTNNDFNAFADTQDSEHLSKSLEDTIYGLLFQGHSLKEFSTIFDEYYTQKLHIIKELAPCSIMMQVYAAKIDLNNLKLCYKNKLAQKEIVWEKLSEEGTIVPERMYMIVDQELWNELPQTICKALIQLQEYATDNLRAIDFLLDSAYYTYRLEILQKAAQRNPEQYKILIEFYQTEIDCENIKNIFRAKTMGLEKNQIADIIIPGGKISLDFFVDYAHLSSEEIADIIKDSFYGEVFNLGIQHWSTTQSCTILEKQIDEFLLEKIGNLIYISEGPAVIEEALRSLQIEIKNLKLIIIGKLNNMAIEEIKERIRHVRA